MRPLLEKVIGDHLADAIDVAAAREDVDVSRRARETVHGQREAATQSVVDALR